jgi:hypothetical protein
MSCPTCGSEGPTDDITTLKSILSNMRYVNDCTIRRFFNMYNLGKKVFHDRPSLLRDYMVHMFGPGQGGCAHDLFTYLREAQVKEGTG